LIIRRKLFICKRLKLDLNLIKLGYKLCTKSLEKGRDGLSRIAEEVVHKVVVE
jgi:hypothetical protein